MKNYELRITNYELFYARIFGVIVSFFILTSFVFAQSRDQNYPTPITANEIGGRIPARDLGDARLTTFYYTFDGTQGDVFINVVTTNLNGDIDVFTADNLRPLTKITVYADSSNNETGRVVYLRQPVKLILRVEGRTPNDDAATFQIKFAGSFAASTAVADPPTAPEVKSKTDSDVRVNSVGTIIEVKPKPTPTPKEVIAKIEKQPKEVKAKNAEKEAEKETEAEKEAEKTESPTKTAKAETKEAVAKKQPKPKREKTPKAPKKPDAVVKEKEKIEETKVETAKEAEEIETEAKKETDEKAETKVETKAEKEATAEAKEPKEKKKSEPIKPVPPAALANINLIIEFKDGSKIERPMSEILKFGVDKGILTVISKNGTIGRYSILDVEKMTVQ